MAVRAKGKACTHHHPIEIEVELEQPNFSSIGEATQIRDLLNDIKDLSDDLSQQQSQVRWLLTQTAEKQRQECFTKISVKNWWKYTLSSNKDFQTIELHRSELVEFYAKEAGVDENKLKCFHYSNFIGKNLSPFCVVDCQDARTRSQILDYMRQSHNSKVKEWTESAQATISALQTDRQNKTGINGVLVWEPLISTFDKLQSMPLKIAMSAVSELLPDLV